MPVRVIEGNCRRVTSLSMTSRNPREWSTELSAIELANTTFPALVSWPGRIAGGLVGQ